MTAEEPDYANKPGDQFTFTEKPEEAVKRIVLPSKDAPLDSLREFLLFSFRAMHTFTGLMRRRLQLLSEQKEGPVLELLVENEFKKIRDVSMSPFGAKDMAAALPELVRCLQSMTEFEREQAKAAKEQAAVAGMETFSPWLNRKLGGGMKAKQLIVLVGDASATSWAMASMYRYLLKHNVPLAHFNTAKQSTDKVPGVKSIPLAWWQNACASIAKATEVFKVMDGSLIALVENVSALLDDSFRALKVLQKVAGHYRVPIVVGARPGTRTVENANVFVVPVELRTLDGKQVCTLGDDICQEEADGGVCVLGGGANSAPKVEDGNGANKGS